jgi:hypothetical protein
MPDTRRIEVVFLKFVLFSEEPSILMPISAQQAQTLTVIVHQALKKK